MDYSWDEAVSNLCHGANVYRFVTIDTGDVGNISKNASKCTTVKTLKLSYQLLPRCLSMESGGLLPYRKVGDAR